MPRGSKPLAERDKRRRESSRAQHLARQRLVKENFKRYQELYQEELVNLRKEEHNEVDSDGSSNAGDADSVGV
jgi:hypothetical protein